ncbi:MAG: SpvB/TcaC N-terminal domain-containing protein [Candidatus Omnitrophota bacterium]
MRPFHLKLQFAILTSLFLWLFLFVLPAPAAYSNTGTCAIEVNPASGESFSGEEVTFVTSYTLPHGCRGIVHVGFMIKDSIPENNNYFYGIYEFNANRMHLMSDQSSGKAGSSEPGSDNVIETLSVSLNCAKSSTYISGNTLYVSWNITFKEPFASSTGKDLYHIILDRRDGITGWEKCGTWTVKKLDETALIGPEGGEVTSECGMIKLIIPEGALTDPARIELLALSESDLEDVVRDEKVLLSAVECKPHGLKFNRPATLIYSLKQAEVPGTPVELGLLSEADSEVSLTGKISEVSSDGYTVKFAIDRFLGSGGVTNPNIAQAQSMASGASAYAAIKALTPTSAPMGQGVQIPLPDMFTGSFGYSIPIAVVPGRAGMQPGVALNYRSSNPNSWIGVGFNLNPGYIVRSTRMGPPAYNDTEDLFYFVSDSGTTELVHLTENLYQARIESSFTKFYKESGDYWRVVSKDAGTLIFGNSSNSRETSSKGTFGWHITKALDTNKNFIQYSYTKDRGKCYLERIDYTGNEIGITPPHTVEFYLEDREDIPSSYISGSKIATAKRLREIRSKCDGELVWKYVLDYEYSPDTGRSLLKAVTQYAGDEVTHLPVQRFEYQLAQ